MPFNSNKEKVWYMPWYGCLGNITVVTEISKAQKDEFYMILLMENISQNNKEKNKRQAYQSLGRVGESVRWL